MNNGLNVQVLIIISEIKQAVVHADFMKQLKLIMIDFALKPI
jgi:hypothetical protein